MTDFLLLAFIFLIAGVIAVPIATRLGLGSVLGYLIAGIVISPILALLNVDVVSIQHFAEFGVVMMLFLVGLELEPKLLWEMRTRLLGLGGGQVLITMLLVTGAAMAMGQPFTVALAISMVLTLSSTAIVLQTLNEKGLMKSDGGQSSFSVLLFQDIAVIPMLAIIPLLAMPEVIEVAANTAATHGSDASHGADDHGASMSLVDGLSGWQTALVTIGAVAAVAIVGNYLTSPIFRFIAGAGLREMFTATALMMVIGIALLMSLVGLSPALGTFLAGVVLANSEYRHELESDVDPFKGLLLGLFFMTVGASINFALLFANVATIIALTIGLMGIKIIVMLGLARAFKIEGSDKWLFALGLAQAGEFAFVLLSFTVANNAMPSEMSDQLLLVVALSMMLTPLLFILYDRVIQPRYAASEEREADEIEEDNHIVIAGHGRVGGMVRRMLQGAGFGVTVIDFSSAQLEMIARFGFKAYFGDATRPDLLHSAGLGEAKLFVIAIDGKEQITELVRYTVKNYPNVHVVARAIDRGHVFELWAAGCRDIIRETYDSSLRMGRSAYEALGLTRDQSERMVATFEAMDRSGMIESAEHYDPNLPFSENEAYIKMVRERLAEWDAELNGQMKVIMNEKKGQPSGEATST
ncbi:MAG: cation:proton antiporter [Pseudomonadota bacterium]